MFGEAHRVVNDAIAHAKGLAPEAARAHLAAAFDVALDAGVDEPTLANLLCHLASAASSAGHGNEAEQHLHDAVARYTRSVGADDSRTTAAYASIAGLRRARGDVRGALAIERETLASRGRASAVHLLVVASDHDDLGERAAADAARDDALRAAYASLADPMTHATGILMLARHLVGSGRVADAEALLEATRTALADDVRVGESISARVPSVVRGEVERALAALRAGEPIRV